MNETTSAAETTVPTSLAQNDYVQDILVPLISSAYAVVQLLLEAEQHSDYQLDKLAVR